MGEGERAVRFAAAVLRTGNSVHEMRQFGAKLGRWAENGLASKYGDDKDENTMIYVHFAAP